MNLIYCYELIKSSRGKVFTATYVKKDNTIRIINCRLHVKKGVNGKGLKYDPIERGLLPVWDMNKQGFRMLNLLTIQSLSINGKKYVV